MTLTEKPKIQRVHLTFKDPEREGSKSVTLYGVTLEQAIQRVTGAKEVTESRSPRRRSDRQSLSA